MTFFGSWVLAFDTSGHVRRDSDSGVFTLAGVAVPEENARTVRRLTQKRLPEKWGDGGLAGFKAAERIIGQTLGVSVTHITGTSAGGWQAFWDEGQRQAEGLKRVTGQPAHFAGGNLAIRATLFAVSFARAVSLVLSRRGWKAPAPPNRKDTVTFSAIFDTDISDPLTQALFIETLQHSLSAGKFATFANLELNISACFKTEQEEPLLMLADYMAGAFNHAHPAAMLGLPVAPVEEVRKAVQAFTEARGANLRVVDRPFNDIHPLTGMTWES